MTPGPVLTVGVPTLNRRESILRMCRSVQPALASGQLALVVVDDGSDDGTSAAVSDQGGDGIRLVRHEVNRGYAHALVSVLEAAETPYVMLAADDDVIDVSLIPALVDWLVPTAPLLARVRHDRATPIPGARPMPTRQMSYREYRDAASHAPGLVLRTSGAREALPFLVEQIEERNEAARIYPQVVLAAWLLVHGEGWWWDAGVVREAELLPSALVDDRGRAYWAPESRLQQALDFQRLLAALEQRVPAGPPRDKVGDLKERNYRTLYPALRNLIQNEQGPSGAAGLDRATVRQLAAATVRRMQGGRRAATPAPAPPTTPDAPA